LVQIETLLALGKILVPQVPWFPRYPALQSCRLVSSLLAKEAQGGWGCSMHNGFWHLRNAGSTHRSGHRVEHFRMRFARASAPLCCLLCFPALGASSSLGQRSTDEFRFKAACLKKIPSFVQWPEAKGQPEDRPFHFCLYGDSSFAMPMARELSGSRIAGRTVDLRLVKAESEMRACDLIFITQTNGSSIARILAPLQGLTILTVGESEGFLEAGGIFELKYDRNTLQINVNLTAAKNAQLKLDSRLLTLAKRVVVQKKQPGI